MATIAERAGQVAGQAARGVLCTGGGYLLDNLPAFGPAGRAARDLARGVHAGACGLPLPPALGEPTTPPPPFTGGQCECAFYSVGYTLVRANPPQTTNGTLVRRGPIGAPVQGAVIPTSPSRKSWGFYYGAAACGGRQFELLSSTGPDGSSGDFTLTITSVTPQAGQPNNCGDPPPGPPVPPVPPPPIPLPPDIDLPVTPPGGGPDVDYTFSPRVGPIFIGVGGVLNMPVVVNVNGPNIDVNAPVTIPVNISLPDFNISFGGGSGGQPDNPDAPPPVGPPPRIPPGPPITVCCDPDPEPGPDITAPVGEPVVGPPPRPKRKLIGIIVTSSVNWNVFTGTEIGQGGGNLNLLVPRLANVYFTVTAQSLSGVPRNGSTSDIPVKLTRQYVAVPTEVTVTDWRVVPEPGVTATVTPLYVASNS